MKWKIGQVAKKGRKLENQKIVGKPKKLEKLED